MTERLSRRDLLATVGVAATGGVAGCLSSVPFTGRSIDEDGLPASTTATTEFRG
ncbi:MAG: twin-arginine translocation signal domain-containing protein, partial [Halobacteriota archaeon]